MAPPPHYVLDAIAAIARMLVAGKTKAISVGRKYNKQFRAHQEGFGLVVVVVEVRGRLKRFFCSAVVKYHLIEDVLAVTVRVSIFVCVMH